MTSTAVERVDPITSSARAWSDGDFSFLFNGHQQPLFPTGSMPGAKREHVGRDFESRIAQVRDNSGIVSAAVMRRALMMTQLRPQWHDWSTGNRFGNASLAPIERPGSMTRQKLFTHVENDASYSGNAYVRRLGSKLFRLRPDWTSIILGSNESPEDVAYGADAEVIGYVYWGGGMDRGRPVLLTPAEVMHFAPEPHPLRVGLGTSWITSIVRDIIQDGQANEHIGNYFEHAATANMVVKAPQGVGLEDFERWVDKFQEAHEGPQNAWKNWYLSSGTDVDVIGASLADLDLRSLTGHIESRVSIRSGVHSALLGTREGMEGSALNAGNYGQIRRLWADTWLVPYAESLMSEFESIVPSPAPEVELDFRRDSVLFLQEDRADESSIAKANASAIRTYVDAGYDPDSATEAVRTGNLSVLEHSGLPSVQVQKATSIPTEGNETDDEGTDADEE